jgi:Polyketide cyclase / dehydrase and lipid transport
MAILKRGQTLSASTHIQASAKDVYAIVSDVTRIPEWSPETYRVEWLIPNGFRAWNRRRLGWWKTDPNVVTTEPDREFSALTTAEKAARLILRGADNSRARVLIGADGRAAAAMPRLLGAGYIELLARLTRRAGSSSR